MYRDSIFNSSRERGLTAEELAGLEKERHSIISADEALKRTGEAIAKRKDEKIWRFMKDGVEPFIQKQINCGRTEVRIEAGSEELAQAAQGILEENGYSTRLSGDTIFISWSGQPA